MPIEASPSHSNLSESSRWSARETRPRFAQRVVESLLRRFTEARLILRFPNGREQAYGDSNYTGRAAVITVRDPRFFSRVLWHGEIGFGEAYMYGEWETDDITRVISFFLTNFDAVPELSGSGARLFFYNVLRRLNGVRHWLRRNTRANSRRNISEHYDLSNDFYSLWLDQTMTYSSAYFKSPDMSLEAAQESKYEQLCQKLDLKPGQRVLEIGCGWGGFALHAARHHGVHVTAITISEEQLRKATQRVRDAGLEGRIDIRFCDYRDVDGQYDAIVSIEMLEAVGHEFLKPYFAQCQRLLSRNGLLGLQVITCPDNRYRASRRKADWIKKHIFPGGQLPSVNAMCQSIQNTGDLTLQHFENFGLNYARTLRTWRERFNSVVDSVRAMGFDDVFIRKWNFYLSYCEAAFAMRNINVAQLIFARPNNTNYLCPGERAAHAGQPQ